MPGCERGRQNWNDLKLKGVSREICDGVGCSFVFPDNFHRFLQDKTKIQDYTE